ncbi:MAG: TetR/AcrR family transcriptional regulator [Acidimicrobiia bacterium]|nr:TetR/AcrR family transcriptional regulator [Acidimicrobiia bacterium]
MTNVEETERPVDGRVARRERNINTVLDVVVEMFTEGELFPTIEQASKRSGLSVRSIYRYFADPTELHDAAIKRHRDQSLPLAHLPSIGRGPLEKRIDDFVAMRLRLYDGVGAAYRATVHNATHHPRLRDELARNRNDFRVQFERQFAPELAALKGADRDAVLSAGDVLTQLDAVDLLRRHRQLSVAEAARALRTGLLGLLESA